MSPRGLHLPFLPPCAESLTAAPRTAPPNPHPTATLPGPGSLQLPGMIPVLPPAAKLLEKQEQTKLVHTAAPRPAPPPSAAPPGQALSCRQLLSWPQNSPSGFLGPHCSPLPHLPPAGSCPLRFHPVSPERPPRHGPRLGSQPLSFQPDSGPLANRRAFPPQQAAPPLSGPLSRFRSLLRACPPHLH